MALNCAKSYRHLRKQGFKFQYQTTGTTGLRHQASYHAAGSRPGEEVKLCMGCGACGMCLQEKLEIKGLFGPPLLPVCAVFLEAYIDQLAARIALQGAFRLCPTLLCKPLA